MCSVAGELGRTTRVVTAIDPTLPTGAPDLQRLIAMTQRFGVAVAV